MKHLLILSLVALSLSLFSQSAYEKGMKKGMSLWSQGNFTEASAIFERIATAEKDNWLPNYYVALVNTTSAFNTSDKTKMDALLNKAQSALNQVLKNDANHPEVLVMQAMIHTAWINIDPMTNGMKLSSTIMELYGKAEAIDPNNPRVVLNKTQFEMGTAKFFGTDTKPLCAKVEKAVELFATFKPESDLHPNWGLNNAEGMMKACK
jgi:tetratricopeptide (TPR) repeat protein